MHIFIGRYTEVVCGRLKVSTRVTAARRRSRALRVALMGGQLINQTSHLIPFRLPERDGRPDISYFGTGRCQPVSSGDARSRGDFGLLPGPKGFLDRGPAMDRLDLKRGHAMDKLDRFERTRPSGWHVPEKYITETQRRKDAEKEKEREGRAAARRQAAARDAEEAVAVRESAASAERTAAEAQWKIEQDVEKARESILSWTGVAVEGAR